MISKACSEVSPFGSLPLALRARFRGGAASLHQHLMSNTMTFYEFLKLKQGRRDNIGKFARLILSVVDDMYPPVSSSKHDKWATWLQNSGATKPTVKVFEAAWELYKNYRNVASISGYLKYKATRSQAQQNHDRLHRLHRTP